MNFICVEGNTTIEAWRAGAREICAAHGSVNNLMTSILEPCNYNEDWVQQKSPHIFTYGADNIANVINTIFPIRLAAEFNERQAFYAAYLLRHDRARRWGHGKHVWGSYFERLVRFPGTEINQLERVIEKLNAWPNRNTAGLVFHLSSPVTDAPRTRGGPCWHYGELLWNPDDSIDLVVVYRNHDFYNKAFGNFIALGQLLKFICDNSGKRPGKLVCHSVHAYNSQSGVKLECLIA